MQQADQVLRVQVQWDDQARVWWATSDDVPGLVTEADSLEQLIDNVRAVTPDLLELNGSTVVAPRIAISFTAERLETVEVPKVA